MKESRKSSKKQPKWAFIAIDRSVDRLAICGRRGTGKSVALRKLVASGVRAVWVTKTKTQARTLPDRFIAPASAELLPEVEVIEGGDFPLFAFGSGKVRVVSFSSIAGLRDTGISVDGQQADVIIRDEVFPRDGMYYRNEPGLLDDLAGTLGRSGRRPAIIIVGNPPATATSRDQANAQPYSYLWRIDVLNEGVYTDADGFTTRVQGTADCRDCFGRIIGLDAAHREYAPMLTTGGTLLTVNGRTIRVRAITDGYLYVGPADGDGLVLMRNNRYTQLTLTPDVSRYLIRLRVAHDNDKIVYANYESQLTLFELLRLRAIV